MIKKFTSKGEIFVEKKLLQLLTEQDNSNTYSYAEVKVYFKENKQQILLHI